jgi:MFS family permease
MEQRKSNPAGFFGGIGRALNHRNYRLFFGGQGVSVIGTWIQQLAMSWLAYKLTRSALWLGWIGFAGQIPTLVVSPFAGVLADRMNRHRIIVITQTLSMIQALSLAVLVLTHTVNVGWLIGLSIFIGIVNAVDIPVRQSFVVEMVENRDDLPNAIALNSTLFNIARMIGPSIAGILVSAVGEGICFLLNGLSYIAVIWALLVMRLKPAPFKPGGREIGDELVEGFRYTFSYRPLWSVISLLGIVSLTGMSYTVLMPVFVQEILHGQANTLGFLMGGAGMGAMLGALYLASRRNPVGLEKHIPVAAGVVGVGLVGLAASKSLWVSLPVLFIIGFGMIVQMGSSNTIIQTVVEERMRGRVMSIYTMAFSGMAPFGSLLAGSLASRIGTPGALLAGGILTIAGGALFAMQIKKFNLAVRPRFIKLGLIAERPSGTQTVVELNPEAIAADEGGESSFDINPDQG